MSANAYSERSEEEHHTVQIHIIDILYNDQVCSLIYMHDLTKILSADVKLQTSKNILIGAKNLTDKLKEAVISAEKQEGPQEEPRLRA